MPCPLARLAELNEPWSGVESFAPSKATRGTIKEIPFDRC